MNLNLDYQKQSLSKWQIGVDEVGRGSVAGPVCVGICVFPTDIGIYTYKYLQSLEMVDPQLFNLDIFWQKLRDSKKTTAKFRKQAFLRAKEISLHYLVFQASSELIDQFGIAVCIRHLLYLGLIALSELNQEFKSSQLFLDGTLKLLEMYNQQLLKSILSENSTQIARLKISHHNVNSLFSNLESGNIWNTWNLQIIEENFADDKFLSVALASNLAKYFRDELMIEFATKYPNYSLEKNVGYGTANQIEAIKKYGLTKIHRQTFLKKYLP